LQPSTFAGFAAIDKWRLFFDWDSQLPDFQEKSAADAAGQTKRLN
jgi:hypothetical protein